MNKEFKWNDLSLKDKAYIIRQAVASGYKDLNEIQDLYNNRNVNYFKGGGKKKTVKRKNVQPSRDELIARSAFDKYFELHPNSQFNTPEWKDMLWQLIGKESGYNVRARSKANATGYAQLMPDNVKAFHTNGDYYDPYNNMLASFKYWDYSKKQLDDMLRSNFTEKDLQNFQNRGWDIYGMLAAAHLGGVNGLKNFLKRGVDNPDAYGTTRNVYLDNFSRINKNRPYNIENTAQKIYTPQDVAALFQTETQQPQQQIIVQQQYTGPSVEEVLNSIGQGTITPEIQDPEVQLIQNNTDNYLLEKAYDYRLNLINQTYLPLTQRFLFNNEVKESPVLKLLNEKPLYDYKQEEDTQETMLNDLLKRAINNSMSNSTFKYALANTFREGGEIPPPSENLTMNDVDWDNVTPDELNVLWQTYGYPEDISERAFNDRRRHVNKPASAELFFRDQAIQTYNSNLEYRSEVDERMKKINHEKELINLAVKNLHNLLSTQLLDISNIASNEKVLGETLADTLSKGIQDAIKQQQEGKVEEWKQYKNVMEICAGALGLLSSGYTLSNSAIKGLEWLLRKRGQQALADKLLTTAITMDKAQLGANAIGSAVNGYDLITDGINPIDATGLVLDANGVLGATNHLRTKGKWGIMLDDVADVLGLFGAGIDGYDAINKLTNDKNEHK